MSKHEFSPAPWVKSDDRIWSGETIVACVTINREQTNADASLISAAPELYEALELAKRYLNHPGGAGAELWFEANEKASAALKRARGEAT